MKKHTKKEFQCPVVGCNDLFDRKDKCRNHVWRTHANDEEAVCPHPDCGGTQLPLDLLMVHCRNHKLKSNDTSLSVLQEYRTLCPLDGCNVILDLFSMQNHLKDHVISDRRANEDAIRAMGYDPVTTHIICPICGVESVILNQFHEHLEVEHIVRDTIHFNMFRQALHAEWRQAWDSWIIGVGSRTLLTCPCCSEELPRNGVWLEARHHLKLLKDNDSIRPYRHAILRLLPRFGSHPVFEDVMPTVDRADR